MDDFKLQRLKQDDPSVVVRHLSDVESERVRTELLARFGLPPSMDGLSLLKHLKERSDMVPGPTADSEDFDLRRVFAAAGISPKGSVYINWNRFDDLDEVHLEQLAKHLDHFWYPKANDIDLLDDTFLWVANVDCEGTIWIARP